MWTTELRYIQGAELYLTMELITIKINWNNKEVKYSLTVKPKFVKNGFEKLKEKKTE